MNHFPLTGACNCGAVRFEMTAPPVGASYWHCRRCQRRSGAAASANVHPAPGTFRIVAGEDRLRVWRPDGAGGEKWFCGDCGSSLFGRNPSHADPIGIRIRSTSASPGSAPSAVRSQVSEALGRLTPEHREILTLAHFRNLTLRQIADSSGTPIDIVHRRATEALRSLKGVLERPA
jgi:hypothetical protein